MGNRMKVEVTALVITDTRTNKLIDFIPVQDENTDVVVTYPPDMIPNVEAIMKGLKDWQNGSKNLICGKYKDGLIIYITEEARNIPSIGYMKVSLETREVDW